MKTFSSPSGEINDDESAVSSATRVSLAGIANFRLKLQQGRTLPAAEPGEPEVRWDVHEQRLDVIEALVRGQRPEDDELRARLTRELIVDFQTELAAKMEACSNRMSGLSESANEIAEEQEL